MENKSHFLKNLRILFLILTISEVRTIGISRSSLMPNSNSFKNSMEKLSLRDYMQQGLNPEWMEK